MMKIIFTLLLSFACFHLLTAQIYVKHDATGVNTGASWADAYINLHAALSAATDNAEVWVAAGTYKPDPASTFLIDKNFRLLGGFAGTETGADQRDPVANMTILSGDLNGDDVEDNFSLNRSDNSRHVVTLNDAVTADMLMDGFYIKNGHASTSPTTGGGALFCTGNPVIRQCVFEQNYAGNWGGAVYISLVSPNPPVFENCRFYRNKSRNGGGLYSNQSYLTLRNCTFTENFTENNIGNGGGIFIYNSEGVMMQHCSFQGNYSKNDGGAMLLTEDQAFAGGAYLEVSDCSFENNYVESGNGGGIKIGTTGSGDYTFINCDFTANVAKTYGGGINLNAGGNDAKYSFVNCNFLENEAANNGAVIFQVAVSSNNMTVLVDSCMFSQNQATEDVGGFGLVGRGKNMNIGMHACRFTGNTCGSESGGADFLGTGGATGTVVVDNCMFENNFAPYSGGLLMGNYHDGGAEVNYQLSNSTFVSNQSMDYGGAIALFTDLPSKCVFLVENCLIQNNTTAGNGGGIDFTPSTTETHAIFRNDRFIGNYCNGDGGAVRIFQFLQNIPFPTNASCQFENCVFAENTSASATITADSLPTLQFLNCTIAGNQGGGIRSSDITEVSLQNTILYNPGFTEYQALTNDVTFVSNGGNLVGDSSLTGQLIVGDKQNLDPLLTGDYRLGSGSPCIDMGVDPGNLPATDLDGNLRVYGAAVDMGAYEYNSVSGAQEPVFLPLQVSPNPAVDFLRTGLSGDSRVLVFDAQGRLMFRQVLPAGEAVDVRALAPGVYFLRAMVGGVGYTGRFVKE